MAYDDQDAAQPQAVDAGQIDPASSQLPKTSSGWIKMVRPDGTRAAVDPAQYADKVKGGYRLPSQQELQAPASAPSDSDIPKVLQSVRTSNGEPMVRIGTAANGRPMLGPPSSRTAISPAPSPTPAPRTAPAPTGAPVHTNPITGQPESSQGILDRLIPNGTAKSLLKGAAESGGSIAVNMADLLSHVMPSLTPSAADRASTVPANTTEKVGKVGTDIGMAMIPGAAATKLAPASAALRILLNAGGSGIMNKLQGGDFTTGAAMGAGGEAAATGVKAVAPSILKSVIPGMSPGVASTMLNKTSGLSASAMADSAGEMAPKAVAGMEDIAGHAHAPVSTTKAVKVVDDAMKKAVDANDTENLNHLRTIRARLLNTAVPGQQARGSEALGVANTLDNLAKKLPSDAGMSYSPGATASKAADVLRQSLDKSAPGTSDLHDTVKALIQGGQAASKAAKAKPNIMMTLARHGITDLFGGGSVYAATHNPAAGIAGAVAAHALSSPAARIGAARVANSPLTPQMINAVKAALLQTQTQ